MNRFVVPVRIAFVRSYWATRLAVTWFETVYVSWGESWNRVVSIWVGSATPSPSRTASMSRVNAWRRFVTSLATRAVSWSRMLLLIPRSPNSRSPWREYEKSTRRSWAVFSVTWADAACNVNSDVRFVVRLVWMPPLNPNVRPTSGWKRRLTVTFVGSS